MACFYMHLAELRDLLHCEMQRLMRLWEGSLPRPRPHACMRTWMVHVFQIGGPPLSAPALNHTRPGGCLSRPHRTRNRKPAARFEGVRQIVARFGKLDAAVRPLSGGHTRSPPHRPRGPPPAAPRSRPSRPRRPPPLIPTHGRVARRQDSKIPQLQQHRPPRTRYHWRGTASASFGTLSPTHRHKAYRRSR